LSRKNEEKVPERSKPEKKLGGGGRGGPEVVKSQGRKSKEKGHKKVEFKRAPPKGTRKWHVFGDSRKLPKAEEGTAPCRSNDTGTDQSPFVRRLST